MPALVHGLENPLTLALVVLAFHLSDFFMAPSGLLAVTVAGLVVGNLKSPVDEDIREFKDQLVLMIGAVFVLLAADIAVADVVALGWAGAAVLARLVLVVRPAAVWLATLGADSSLREKVFFSAIAPRGIVAAALASLTAGALGADVAQRGLELRALVFLVIAGPSSSPASRRSRSPRCSGCGCPRAIGARFSARRDSASRSRAR